MKLLLVNLYPKQTMAAYLLSSYVLKAYLEENLDPGQRPKIEVLNFPAQKPPAEMAQEITAHSPDWIGYSCYLWNIEPIIELIGIIKKTLSCLHILGGPEISAERILFLERREAGDFYVIGAGEEPLAGLMAPFMAGRTEGADLPAGVVHRGQNPLACRVEKRGADLAKVPSVYLTDALPQRFYKRRQAFLETQRGCIRRCKYCVYHKGLPAISYFDLDRVIQELDHLILKNHILALRILDSVFTSDLARAKTIVRHLFELKNQDQVRLPLIFWDYTYSSVDDEFLGLVAALKYGSAIHNIAQVKPMNRPQSYSELIKDYTVLNEVGLQSFHNQALKAVGRAGISKSRFAAFMDQVREHNLVLKLDIILGLPHETFGSYFAGLEFLLPYLKGTDHILNLHRLSMLPGSDLEAESSALGLRYAQEAPHLVYASKTMSEEKMGYASRLTAVLYRIFNSPLRIPFFIAWERTGLGLADFLEVLRRQIVSAVGEAAARLAEGEWPDDDYWTETIYQATPTSLLQEMLARH